MHGCSFDRLFLFTMDIVYGHLTYFSQKILFIFFFFFFLVQHCFSQYVSILSHSVLLIFAVVLWAVN